MDKQQDAERAQVKTEILNVVTEIQRICEQYHVELEEVRKRASAASELLSARAHELCGNTAVTEEGVERPLHDLLCHELPAAMATLLVSHGMKLLRNVNTCQEVDPDMLLVEAFVRVKREVVKLQNEDDAVGELLRNAPKA